MAGGTAETAVTAGAGPRPAPEHGRHGTGTGTGRGGRRRIRRTAAAAAAAAAALFTGYLRVSWTVPTTSDGAAQALQARDMLAGNWLLHGWTLSDVSFYTTELPEYLLVELVRPFGAGVIHVAAAATYTLLVLAAAALARGRARGAEGLARGAVAATVMLAPQLGYGAFVLLLSPDHVGTELPLLLGWLLLDLAPRRWWRPAALAVLLAWVQLADRIALLTAAAPLLVVCAATVLGKRLPGKRRRPRAAGRQRGGRQRGGRQRGGRQRGGRRHGGLRRGERMAGGCLECQPAALAAAAVASAGIAWGAARLLGAAGGFAGHRLALAAAPPGLLWTHAWLTGWGILELYGANFLGVSGWIGVALALAHLAGLALGGTGFAVALGRFLRPGGGRNLTEGVLAVAIAANLLCYALSTAPGTVRGTGYDAREIAAVLPLGAVLAGRVVGPVLARHGGRRIRPALVLSASCCVIAAYGAALGYSAAQPGARGADAVLARWLAGHGFRYGLGGATANAMTVDSGARVRIVPTVVRRGRVLPLLYQSSTAAYDPALHDATFLVSEVPSGEPGGQAPGGQAPGGQAPGVPWAAVRATFGTPARVYRIAGYTICAWNVNLLTRLGEMGG